MHRAVTGALHRNELAPFVANGFQVHEHLHLLRHDLVDVPEDPRNHRLRRARRRDRARILDIDNRAFDDFWTLDHAGLIDAVRATPSTRFRVSQTRGGPVTGYAITGRANDRGYLQRLAVDPDHHRAGLGRALVADSLIWLRRTGARAAMVNTQTVNQGALALYLACGFEAEAEGLTVLALDLNSKP